MAIVKKIKIFVIMKNILYLCFVKQKSNNKNGNSKREIHDWY